MRFLKSCGGKQTDIYYILYFLMIYETNITTPDRQKAKKYNISADQLKRRYRESIQNYIMGIKRLSIDTCITGLPNMHNL